MENKPKLAASVFQVSEWYYSFMSRKPTGGAYLVAQVPQLPNPVPTASDFLNSAAVNQ